MRFAAAVERLQGTVRYPYYVLGLGRGLGLGLWLGWLQGTVPLIHDQKD